MMAMLVTAAAAAVVLLISIIPRNDNASLFLLMQLLVLLPFRGCYPTTSPTGIMLMTITVGLSFYFSKVNMAYSRGRQDQGLPIISNRCPLYTKNYIS